MDLAKKIEAAIFYLLIFSIPFEVRVIVVQWTQPFNEWMSASLYGTDVLIGLLFLFWVVRRGKINWRKSDFALVGFFVVSLLSVFQALNKELAVYQLIKLAEFIGLYWYIKVRAKEGLITVKNTMTVIIASGFFQAIVAIIQYLKQSNIGLKYLGETVLGPNMPSVAVVIVNGEKFLRSYGTTLHPNVLAAFLFLAVYSFYFLFFYKKIFTKTKGMNLGSLIIYALLVLGLLFTFSRVAIFLWLLGAAAGSGLVFFIKRFKDLSKEILPSLKFMILTTVIILAVFSFLFYPQVISRLNFSGQDQAVSLRLWYAGQGVGALKADFLLGNGIGNFVPYLVSVQKNIPFWQYQPVHNIFLLIGSETGILGLAVFLAFLFLLSKEYFRKTGFAKLYHFSFFLVFGSFLVMGFFDHFLWTLQSGRLMFWLVAALISISVDEKI